MPGILDKGVSAVESLLAHVGRYLIGRDMASYCELCTALPLSEDDMRHMPGMNDPYVLVTDSNSLATVYDLQGCFQITSAQDFETIVDNLRVKMNGYLSRPGHSLSLGFERDPERAHDELMRLAEPMIKTARRIGLRSEDIILNRVRRNAPLVAYEQNLLVLYTHMNVMSDDEAKRELKDRVERATKHRLPYLDFGQNPAAVLMAMKLRHDAMVSRVKQDFETCGLAGAPGIMLKPMGAHEAIKRLRIMLNRERTSQKYRPVLPGDRFIPHGREDARDFSDLSAPLIGYQLATASVDIEGELIRSQDLWHANLSLELGPQEPQRFAELMRNVNPRMPWRMRLDLCPGGLNETRGRQMMLAFAGMFPANKSIKQSFIDLRERSRHDAILSMKVTASTWGHSEHEAKQRAASLEQALQAWGTCQVTDVHGDPMAAWASTIPGFTTRNVANRWLPPLDDALTVLPLQRPATPWAETGNVLTRTPDGKIYPLQPASAQQDTWIELGSAPPGSGKTTLLNTINLALLHNPGSARLPLMTMIEVKPGSAGLIQLIQDSLPPHRQHEAVYLRLRNTDEFAVNIWDTQLGARRPTSREADFQTDFMNALCMDAKLGAAPSDCARVNAMLIDIVYAELAGTKANQYEPSVDREVDAALDAHGIRDSHDDDWWLHATWYEVTDLLFAKGLYREAAVAQRHASPVLSDFIAALHHSSITGVHGSAMYSDKETLLEYMARCFHAASTSYRLFSGRTRFELSSETRVVGMDLNEVVGGQSVEGKARTSIMYMFARHLAARNYFLREELLLPHVPPLYKEYHRARVADIRDEKKHISYDEFHNTGGLQSFTATVIKDGREGREWGIRIAAFSQFLHDYPDDLLDAATCVYVMRGGSSDDEKVLRQKFAVSDEAIRRLQREAVGPNAEEGGNFLALFKTKSGLVVQMLTNTVGAVEAWAFSTTSDDVSLRTRLYEALGTYAARKLLAHHFPLGTARVSLELMRANAPEGAQKSVVAELANKLLEEHARQLQTQKGPLQ